MLTDALCGRSCVDGIAEISITVYAARHVQVCSAATSALEAVLAHAEPGQCLPLLQREMQTDQQPDNADAAKALQVCLLCIMTSSLDARDQPLLGLSLRAGNLARTFCWKFVE